MTDTPHKPDDRNASGFRRIGDILTASGAINLARLSDAHEAALEDIAARPRHPITRGLE